MSRFWTDKEYDEYYEHARQEVCYSCWKHEENDDPYRDYDQCEEGLQLYDKCSEAHSERVKNEERDWTSFERCYKAIPIEPTKPPNGWLRKLFAKWYGY